MVNKKGSLWASFFYAFHKNFQFRKYFYLLKLDFWQDYIIEN